MPCGKKRKRHKIATHKRKKRLRKNWPAIVNKTTNKSHQDVIMIFVDSLTRPRFKF
jgi:hypothetical protein